MILFLNISSGEIITLIVVVAIVYGPTKMPDLIRGYRKIASQFNRVRTEVENEVGKEAGKFVNEIKRYSKGVEEEVGKTKIRIMETFDDDKSS